MSSAIVLIIILAFVVGFLVVGIVYGFNPKKWKPKIFTKDVTVQSLFSQKKNKKK